MFSSAIPYIVYGSLGLVCAFLTIFLPETLNRPLPDTVPPWNCFCVKTDSQEVPATEGQSSRPADEVLHTVYGNGETKGEEDVELLSVSHKPKDNVWDTGTTIQT